MLVLGDNLMSFGEVSQGVFRMVQASRLPYKYLNVKRRCYDALNVLIAL
jgi:hypothetical protein